MKRRKVVAIVAGTGISGCLGLQETQPDTSEDGASESGDRGSSERSVADVELTELRDFGGPSDEPNPSFTFGDRFGANAYRRNQVGPIVLMNADGEVVWESELINADYSIERNFIGTPEQYYIWFIRDGGTYVSAFDPDTGAERWTRELVDRDTRKLNEIIATEIGVFHLTTAAQNDQYNQSPRVTHVGSDGEERWSKTIRDEGSGRALLVYEDDLYVGISETMVRLNAGSGDIADTYDIQTNHNGFTRRSSEMYVDARVNHDEVLLKLDLASHEVVWENDDARDIVGRPVVTENLVLVAGEAGWIDAYDVSDGDHRWEARLDQTVRNLARTGNVLWATSNDNLYAFDLFTGEQVYNREDGQYRDVVALNGRVSIRDYDEATLYEVAEIPES
jgi:outer membrane protein assembly factor BamB